MSARHQLDVNESGEIRRRYSVDAIDELWRVIQHLYESAKAMMAKGGGVEIRIKHLSGPTIEQRKKLHATCCDLSEQADWHGRKLSLNGWKRLAIAAYREQEGHKQYTVPNWHNDGFIVISEESSEDLTRKEYASVIDLLTALGNERAVVWSDPTAPRIEDYSR